MALIDGYMYPEGKATEIWDCEPLKSHPPIFLEGQPFPFLEPSPRRPARTVTSYEPSSLREIQSCAGPRTKIFLCSVISKRKKNIHTREKGKGGRRDIIERCGRVCVRG